MPSPTKLLAIYMTEQSITIQINLELIANPSIWLLLDDKRDFISWRKIANPQVWLSVDDKFVQPPASSAAPLGRRRRRGPHDHPKLDSNYCAQGEAHF